MVSGDDDLFDDEPTSGVGSEEKKTSAAKEGVNSDKNTPYDHTGEKWRRKKSIN
jgi:hypothetical protein